MAGMNYTAWPAFDGWESTGVWTDPPIPDHAIVRDEMRVGLLADELGYDSLWAVEHHLTPYHLLTNPLQWLSFFAGATKNLDLGTFVIVLPWHHPVRVAEDITMLQNLLGEARTLTIGVGRGAARREFNGLSIPMDESRERFVEAVQIVKLALTQNTFAFDGKHYQVPSISIRPQPRDGAAIVNDLYCAWGSAQTIPIAADLDLKPLLIPQKPLAAYVDDLQQFADLRSGSQPHPIVALSIYCDESEEKARVGALKHFTEYMDGAVRSYELYSRHFANTKGYEAYAQAADAVLDREEMSRNMGQMWFENHVWGTPEMCAEKIDYRLDS
jgi:alkanesulfonate monooxygenase SsuD/methylene tetrahydromethanopterin reductase-like flavin-dependent oxidoreductase (luciferase family)